ncbi:hypothetical protein [Vibrio crassostreae]|uniref:hypothetical protein n=1 Tax=Vibrio crassostreae TaxID=246167 RepID=UPI001B30AED1|nr:hypothetical protein [Vibrio crassostreae]
MKLNNFFVMGATAFAMTSGSAYSADNAEATAVWTGLVSSSAPSANLKITGRSGGNIEPGVLLVNENGTFTSTEVQLEAHDYDPDTETVGDLQPLADWTYMSSTVMIGGDFTQEAVVKVFNEGQELTLGTPSDQSDTVMLKVQNEAEITDVTVEGVAQVSVLMSASYVAAL